MGDVTCFIEAAEQIGGKDEKSGTLILVPVSVPVCTTLQKVLLGLLQ